MKLGESIVTVLLAIVGVAVIAVIVSRNSNTSNVISAGAGGFASSLGCALSPVTGASCGSSGLSSVTSTFTPLQQL